MKVCGTNVKWLLLLGVLVAEEVGRIRVVAVKFLDMTKNSE